MGAFIIIRPKCITTGVSARYLWTLIKPLRSPYMLRHRVQHGTRFVTGVSSPMALEAYAEGNSDRVHVDVLAKAREACYKARDNFYACLEKNSDKKPTEIASVGLLYPVECKESRAQFVKQCRTSWVKHFDRQYCKDKRVQRLLDDKESRRGPLMLPQPYTFKPAS